MTACPPFPRLRIDQAGARQDAIGGTADRRLPTGSAALLPSMGGSVPQTDWGRPSALQDTSASRSAFPVRSPLCAEIGRIALEQFGRGRQGNSGALIGTLPTASPIMLENYRPGVTSDQ